MSETRLCRVHANVFAMPASVSPGGSLELAGGGLPTLAGPEGGPPAYDTTLPVTFEEMQQRLLELPRSDCEPDGFFLVTGGQRATFWRLNGHMHEASLASSGRRMHRVELNGECPEPVLDEILRTMGWPEAELIFELVKEGAALAEQDFRRWILNGPASPTEPP